MPSTVPDRISADYPDSAKLESPAHGQGFRRWLVSVLLANSAGKYPLDSTEIRAAFALSEALPERIRRFRDERLAKIIADEMPVNLEPHPRLMLHMVPVSSMLGTATLDIHRGCEKRSKSFAPL